MTWGQEVWEASQERGWGSGHDTNMRTTRATVPPRAPWPNPLGGTTVKGLLQETPVRQITGRTWQKPHGSRAASAGGHFRARPLQQTAERMQTAAHPAGRPSSGGPEPRSNLALQLPLGWAPCTRHRQPHPLSSLQLAHSRRHECAPHLRLWLGLQQGGLRGDRGAPGCVSNHPRETAARGECRASSLGAAAPPQLRCKGP